MNQENNFEKKVLDKLDKHQPYADYNNLWDTFETHLIPINKPPLLTSFLYMSGFIVLLTGIAYFGSRMITNESESSLDSDKVETSILKNNLDNQSDRVYHTILTREAQQNKSITIESKENTFSIKSEVNKSGFKSASTSTIIINNESSKSTNQKNEVLVNGIHNPVDQYKAQLVNLNMLDVSEALLTDQKSTGKVISNRTVKNTTENKSTFYESRGLGLESLSALNNKTSIEKVISLDLLPITLLNKPVRNLYIESMSLDSINMDSSLPKKWNFDFTLLTNISNLKGLNLVDDPTITRHKLGPIIGFGVESSVSYALSSKFRVLAGLNWSTYIDKFDYFNATRIQGDFENPQAYVVDGEYISAIQNFPKTITTDVVHYNTQNILSLKTGMQYSISKNIFVELSLHTNLYQSYSGRLIDDNVQLDRNGPVLDQVKLVSFAPSIKLGYTRLNFIPGRPSLIFGYKGVKYTSTSNSQFTNVRRNVIDLGMRWPLN